MKVDLPACFLCFMLSSILSHYIVFSLKFSSDTPISFINGLPAYECVCMQYIHMTTQKCHCAMELQIQGNTSCIMDCFFVYKSSQNHLELWWIICWQLLMLFTRDNIFSWWFFLLMFIKTNWMHNFMYAAVSFG